MDIQVKWFDEAQTMVLMQFPEEWSWADFREATRQLREIYGGVSYPVYAIADFTHSVKSPALSIPELREIAISSANSSSNLKLTFIVGSGARIKFLLDIFSRLFPSAFRRYRVAKNMDKALEDIHTLKMPVS